MCLFWRRDKGKERVCVLHHQLVLNFTMHENRLIGRGLNRGWRILTLQYHQYKLFTWQSEFKIVWWNTLLVHVQCIYPVYVLMVYILNTCSHPMQPPKCFARKLLKTKTCVWTVKYFTVDFWCLKTCQVYMCIMYLWESLVNKHCDNQLWPGVFMK